MIHLSNNFSIGPYLFALRKACGTVWMQNVISELPQQVLTCLNKYEVRAKIHMHSSMLCALYSVNAYKNTHTYKTNLNMTV